MGQTGRPTKYTKELADEICALLATGMSARSVLREEHMPSMNTFWRWIRENDEFREQYARAKDEASEAIAEDMFDIADDGTNDWMDVKFGKETRRVVDNEALGRSKLRVDTRKWYLSKIKPKKYGEHLKIDQETEITHKFEDLSDDELDEAIEKAKDQIS